MGAQGEEEHFGEGLEYWCPSPSLPHIWAVIRRDAWRVAASDPTWPYATCCSRMDCTTHPTLASFGWLNSSLKGGTVLLIVFIFYFKLSGNRSVKKLNNCYSPSLLTSSFCIHSNLMNTNEVIFLFPFVPMFHPRILHTLSWIHLLKYCLECFVQPSSFSKCRMAVGFPLTWPTSIGSMLSLKDKWPCGIWFAYL